MKESELVVKLNELHTTFTVAQEKAEGEQRAMGEASAETRGIVDQMVVDIAKMVKDLDEARALAKAPSAEELETEASELHKRAIDKYLRKGFSAVIDPEEKRVLSEASDGDGAFFAPEEMESNITMNASQIAVIRPLANVGTTSRHVVIGPMLSKPAVSWGVELADYSALTLGAGANRLSINDLKALWTISNDTLEDAEANIVGELSQAFARVIAEAEDTAFAAGTGSNQPEGIITNAAIQARYTASGVADALSNASNNGMDALITALTSLKGVYRSNATFLFNSTTLGVILKLKDGEGRYLWQPSSMEGKPNSLIGRPVSVAEGMPDIAAGAFPIVIGDLRLGYKIRDRKGLTITRLNERYAEKDQVGFIVKKRVGGQPVLTEAFQCVKIATS